MKIVNAEILSVYNLNNSTCCIKLAADEIAKIAKPGQFVEISTNCATILNKPISIADVSVNRQNLSIVVKGVGKGSNAINKLKRGDRIKLIGPCGNSFPPPNQKEGILVGGGVGVPPLFFMAKKYKQINFSVIIGANTEKNIILENEFRSLDNTKLFITTDDGSRGIKGTVIRVLKELIKSKELPIYSCGPHPMLAAVAEISKRLNLTAYLSLESYMGCGFGVCMGCVIPTVRGYERVCKEGPVFLANDILWEKYEK